MTTDQAEAAKGVDDVLAHIDKALEEAEAVKTYEPSEVVTHEPPEAAESPAAAAETPPAPATPPLAPAAPQAPPSPVVCKVDEGDWWNNVYYDDQAHWDTNTGNITDDEPRPGPTGKVPPKPRHAPTPAAPSDVGKADVQDVDEGKEHSGAAGTVEKVDDDQADDDTSVTRAWRQAKALRALARVEGRRRAALLYLPGTALAWGLGWHQRVIAYMDAGYVAPDQLVGSLIGLSALGGGLWLAVRKKSPLLAATALVTAGVGYAEGGTRAVAYMTAHGFDPATVTPVGSALLAGALTWWFIDCRTAHWFPLLACAMRTPTAAIGLALIFYAAPTL
jgi:hypothetical protein